MIASIVPSLLMLCLIVAMGAIPVALLSTRTRRPLLETVGLTLSLGMCLTAMLLFWASLCGLLPTRQLQALLALVACVGVWAATRKRAAQPSDPTHRSAVWPAHLLLALPWLMVALVAVLVALICVLSPVVEWDAFAIWALKGRVLAAETLRSRPAVFYEPSFSYSHHDYPLLVPMLMAGFYSAAGALVDEIAKVVFLLVFLSLVLIAYSGMKRLAGRWVAAAGVAIFVTTPGMLQWAGTGYADSTVALYCCGAAAYLALYARDARREDLTLGLLHLAGLAFSKNEGLLIAGSYGVILAALCLTRSRRPQLRAVVIGLLCVAGTITPFLLWRSTVPQTHENYGARLTGSLGIWQVGRLKVILAAMGHEMFSVDGWGLLWYVPVGVLIAGIRHVRSREVVFLGLALLAQSGSYVLAYLVSPYSPESLIPVTLDRLVLQASPLAMLLTAAIAGRLGHASVSACAIEQQTMPITR